MPPNTGSSVDLGHVGGRPLSPDGGFYGRAFQHRHDDRGDGGAPMLFERVVPRGQPSLTIQALAFRAGEHIARFAKRGEI